MRCINFIGVFLTVVLAACSTPSPRNKPSPPQTAVENPAPATNAAAPAAPTGEISIDTVARYQDALAALRSGDRELAERLLQDVSRLHPQLAGPQANLGLIYSARNDYPRAEAALLAATAADPALAAAHNELGIIYRKTGRFDAARAAYQAALAADASYAPSTLNIAILYDLYLNDLDQALAHYEKYLTLQPAADEPVKKWVAELKQRIKARPSTPAEKGP